MPRSVEPIPVTLFTAWTNWSQNQRGETHGFRPGSISELVAAVLRAETDGKTLRPQGSSWSCSPVAKPEGYRADTRRLDRILRPSLRGIADLWKGDTTMLVHVEAGIKLHLLAETLWAQGKSLPTLGGDLGQSLAGALSTGTHGPEFDISGLPSMVRAIHLVGAGGQEYWVERPGAPVFSDDALGRLAEWDDTIQVVRGDDAFLSALVSLGRCGVVYSYVLEVEPAFKVEEERVQRTWNQVLDQLKAAAHDPQGFVSHMRRVAGDPVFGRSAELRSYDVAFNPEEGGQRAWVTRRWKQSDMSLPDEWPAGGFTLSECLKSVLVAGSQIVDRLGHFRWASVEVYNRIFPGDSKIRGPNYLVSVGNPAPYPNYEDKYDAHWRDAPRGRFLEVFFDAEDDAYLSYIDTLLYRFFQGNSGSQAGYLALRFTKQSEAPLGMARWPVTACVELVLSEGFSGTEYGLNLALSEAKDMGATVHWGMLLLDGGYPNGDKEAWRAGARRLGAAAGDVFSSDFSVEYELEP